MFTTSLSVRVNHAMLYCGLVAIVFLALRPLSVQARQCDGWQQMQATGPARRSSCSMVYMEREHQTLLFGGYSYEDGHSVRFGDTWTWDGTRWTDLHVTGPSPRSSASMAYDPIGDVVLLYGGHSADGRPTDTWQWDGQQWQLLSETGPDITDEQPMTFDPTIGRILLFDGRTGRPSKTWVWTGQQWMAIATNGPAVSDYTLVTDVDRSRVVLVASHPYEQIWEWDGRHWALIHDGTGPGAFFNFAAAYDTVRHSIFFIGGAYGDDQNDETWEWDGAAWTRVAVEPRLARTSHRMAYDASRDRLVVFGGYIDGQYSDETWEADAETFLYITDQPRSHDVRPGQSTGFGVRVLGSGPISYQWRKDGVPLNDGGRITGSRTDTLHIDYVGLSDLGTYDVMVTRDCGSIISDPAELTFTVIPQLIARGHCPGTVGVRLTGARPDGLVILFYGGSMGRTERWLEPCGPVAIDLGPPRVGIIGWFRPDSNGTLVASGHATSGWCDGYLQCYDLRQCLPSNVVEVP